MSEQRPFILIAIDLETTDLESSRSEIIEIAGVRFDLFGEQLDRFERLVNPGRKIPAHVAGMTGITDKMVEDAPTIDAMLGDFQAWVGDREAQLIAHNAPFEAAFLLEAYRRAGDAIPGVEDCGYASVGDRLES